MRSIVPDRPSPPIQAALRATDLSADQIMIGYNGVKFGLDGQNQLASTLLVQLRDTSWDVVWPGIRRRRPRSFCRSRADLTALHSPGRA